MARRNVKVAKEVNLTVPEVDKIVMLDGEGTFDVLPSTPAPVTYPEYVKLVQSLADRILNTMLKIVDACYESSGRGVVQPWKGIREEIERMM